jgi:hypothetical protein
MLTSEANIIAGLLALINSRESQVFWHDATEMNCRQSLPCAGRILHDVCREGGARRTV